MSTVTIIQPGSSETFKDVDCIFEFLTGHFRRWPIAAKLYCDDKLLKTECYADLELIEGLKGSFEVVIEPQGVVAAVSAVGLGAAALRRGSGRDTSAANFTPTQVIANQVDEEQTQSNNRITGQRNETRTARRIPDIYGQVRAFPDKIFPDYVSAGSVISCYWIGKGEFEVADFQVDGEPVETSLESYGIEIYGPGKQPNTHEPDVLLGSEISEPLAFYKTIYDHENGGPWPTTEESVISVAYNFEGSGPSLPLRVSFIRISDQATTSTDTDIIPDQDALTFENPYAGQPTEVQFMLVGFNREPDVLYTEEEYGATIGFPRFFNGELVEYDSSVHGGTDADGNLPVRMQGEIIEQTITEAEIAEIVPCEDVDFGNGTMVYVKSSTQLNDQFSLLATRKIPCLENDLSFSEPKATRDAASIFVAAAIDQDIGRLQLTDLDLRGIRDSVDEVIARFGDERASYFSYTFDDVNLSFEDTARIIAEAVFCTVSRLGNIIELRFETEQTIPSLLFNDFNKLPNSEEREFVFGNEKNYDSVRLSYFDQVSGEELSLTVPEDFSGNIPKSIRTIGIRTKFQAYFHAHREFQKLMEQSLSIKFDTTSEANLLSINDLILVSDSTISIAESGKVVSIDENLLGISKPVILSPLKQYVIFVQSKSGEVLKRMVSQNEDRSFVILDQPIVEDELSIDPDNFARATYTIVEDSDSDLDLFLVTQKSVGEGLVISIEAVNYTDSYYSRDRDFIEGLFVDTEDSTITTFGATAPIFNHIRPNNFFIYVTPLPSLFNVDFEARDINGDNIIYSIEGADAGRFRLDDENKLRFITPPTTDNPQDTNGNNFYEIIAVASDGTLERRVPLTIAVADSSFEFFGIDRTENLPPIAPYFENLTDGQVALVQENVTGSFFTVRSFDPNGDTVQYFIIGGSDAQFFQLNSNTGELSFENSPDFESPLDSNADNIYDVRIRITDGFQFREATLSVQVTDENEGL